MRVKLALLLALPLFLAACSASGTASRGAPGGGTGDSFTNISAPLAVPAPEAQKAGGVAVGAPAPNQGLPNPVAFNADRNLIRTANIAMRSKDPWATSERAAAIAVGYGGDVLGLAQSGNGDDRRANLTIRVPASRFDDALNQIKQLEGEAATSKLDTYARTDQFSRLHARRGAT